MKNAVDIDRIKCYNTNRKPLRLRRKDVKDMMKHEEMITLIGNMFINAYVAGDRKDLDSFRSARADRDHLFDEIRNLYAELEHEIYGREQFEVELKEEQEHKKSLYETIRKMDAEIVRLNDRIRETDADILRLKEAKMNMGAVYGESISHVDDRSLYPSAVDNREEWLRKNTTVFDHIPDDADKFSEQDLPFPDVEDLAPASEVEGSEE